MTTKQHPWQKKTDSVPLRVSLVIEDKIYGIDHAAGQVNIYDPTQNQWIKKSTEFPSEFKVRDNAVFFAINNKGYYGLGRDDNMSHYDFWEYNPNTNQWARKQDFPGSCPVDPATFSIDSRGYVALGTYLHYEEGSVKSEGSYLGNELWEYDPERDIWTRLSDYPGQPKTRAKGFSINRHGYIAGGNISTHTPEGTSEFYEYNPVSNQWAKRANIPADQYAGNLSGGIVYGKLYISYWYDMSNFQIYDPLSDEWLISEEKLYSGEPAIIQSVGNKLYLWPYPGNRNSAQTELWEYTPSNE